MKNVYLFGAGYWGKNAYYKLKGRLNILAFIDNNVSKRDSNELFGIPIIDGTCLDNIDMSDSDIIICIRDYFEVADQLVNLGIDSYYIYFDGFLYHNDQTEIMMSVEVYDFKYSKKNRDEKNILFVQNCACIRTHKIASVMKAAGYKVFLLYSLLPPIEQYKEYEKIYDEIWTFTSIDGINKFIENGEFDVVHCSNEPDILVNIANLTNKPVVADTHDMTSMRDLPQTESALLEYLANNRCNGNIYPSQGVKDYAEKKYGLKNTEVYVLENLILDQKTLKPLTKKSDIDHELHCVYEGGIEFTRSELPKYFEDIWTKMAEEGIHIHFYSSNAEQCKKLEKKCKYLHYEGNVGSNDLIQEMVQYDCGLAIYNVMKKNKSLVETYSPNKICEYLEAGIPVASNVNSHIQFIREHNVGDGVDISVSIKTQLERIVAKRVPVDFLKNNRLTMVSRTEELITFYEKVRERFNSN